jgi:hypothetical protein
MRVQLKVLQNRVCSLTSHADVLRLLSGRCADPHAPCQLDQNGDQIRLVFSGSALSDFYECAKELPADTVLLIEVTPADSIPMKKMRLGRNLKLLGPHSLGFADIWTNNTQFEG